MDLSKVTPYIVAWNCKNVKINYVRGCKLDQDEKMLYARIDDKIREALYGYRLTSLGFLSPGERILSEKYLTGQDVVYFFWGGYDDAERTLLLLKPDDDTIPFLPEGNESMALIRFDSFAEGKVLSHRDYLGSLMGAGLKRDAVGDILPYSDGKRQYCDIVVLRSVAGDILANLDRIGRTGVRVREADIQDLHLPEKSFKIISDTVASMRLDAVIASGFGISRSEAKLLVERGLVSRNYAVELSPGVNLHQGDILSARGHGKLELMEIGGATKKQRIRIQLKKYI